MALGPVMLDLRGTSLQQDEHEKLLHPLTGGVILFSRNYADPEQISQLISEIHALRSPHLLVAVDHEGGPVQRFRTGFTTLPPAAAIGRLYKQDKNSALQAARSIGWLMAAELRTVGVDISFAPVLDLAYGVSSVIGKRAFHRNPEAVADIAHAYMLGMRDAGMAAVGKHFPGHGHVREDSHIAHPVDRRRLEDMWLADMLPFERMIHYGLQGIMPAHIVFEQIDQYPVGYSEIWLQNILRKQLGFQGAIFSDDLSMKGADLDGTCYSDRATRALNAGCDMLLICNAPAGANEVLAGIADYQNPAAQARLIIMHGRHPLTRPELEKNTRWQAAVNLAAQLGEFSADELNL